MDNMVWDILDNTEQDMLVVVRKTLTEAVSISASDIHINPEFSRVRVPNAR